MKRAMLAILLSALIVTGCHTTTRNLGGQMEIKLPRGQKLEEITWKDGDQTLWYLTRPMRTGEEPETHTFKADSEWGIFEGTVTIIESK